MYQTENSISSSYNIINICLIPDVNIPEAVEFTQQVIDVSKQQNLLNSSQYEICAAIDGSDSRLSLTHCTLMHMKVPDDQASMKFLADKLEPIIGQSYTLTVNGIEVLPQIPMFIRDNLLTNTPTSQLGDVQWVSVEKEESLLKLQEEVVAMAESKDVTLITGRKERYRPHFTFWVKETKKESDRINSEQQKIMQDYSKKMKGVSVPCKVAVGSCGPIGQVTQVQTTASFICKP